MADVAKVPQIVSIQPAVMKQKITVTIKKPPMRRLL
jgi:hypothetical protein